MSNKKQVSLANMETGRRGTIMEFRSGTGLTRRLESMGIRLGKEVTKISGMPLRGPLVVQVGGTRIALGHGMAMKVIVQLS